MKPKSHQKQSNPQDQAKVTLWAAEELVQETSELVQSLPEGKWDV